MRERLVETLQPVTHRRFLVYLMGPYRAFPVAEMVPEDVDPAALDVSFDDWDDRAGGYEEVDVLGLLERTRDHLRTEAGLNAFLAIDADVPLEEMDAASQSVAFARASNVVALVAPNVGRNLGVGIETGAVLEALGDDEQERVVFVHEEGVTSALIASLSRRWDATVYAYSDEAELSRRLREFAVDVMNRERYGDLDPLD